MKKKQHKVSIGIGHVVRALQMSGFGHEEIMAMREAMIASKFDKINFCEDIYYKKDVVKI